MQPSRVVLVVEADIPLQAAIVRALEQEGYTVLAASDHRGALRRLAERTPDAVCVGLRLPDEPGYTLCEQIRRTDGVATVPLIAMDESAFPEQMAHAERAGANAFLKKPFPMRRLLRCLQAVLDDIPASAVQVRQLGAR